MNNLPLPQEEDDNVIIDAEIGERLFGTEFPDHDLFLEEQWSNQFEG